MEGKRPSDELGSDGIKRLKTTRDYEVLLDHDVYVDVDKLFGDPTLGPYFNKTYSRSVANLIKSAALDVVNVARKNVADGVFDSKPRYSSKLDIRVVKKDAKINAIIEEARGRSYPLAPAVILGQDLEFFVDALGERHDVEMRGARTVRGIYFKVKDVGRVFGTADLANDIQHKNTKPREGEDYVWFTMPHGEKKSASRELFFTFLGLLRAIMRARTPIAEQLCIWVCDTVFVHGFGTEDQKVELINKMDKKTLDTFMKCCAHDIACIYLLETSMKQAESTKKVFKFGFTKQLKSRMGKHNTTFGPDCVLDTIIIIPEESLSGAEADLKRQLPTQYFFTHGSAQELLLLSEADRKTVRAAMQTVATAYGGTTAVHEQRLKNVEQSYQLETERIKNEHLEERSKLKEALIVATKDVALAEKETMLAKKDIIILQMQNDEQARRLKELEDELRRYAKNRPCSPTG